MKIRSISVLVCILASFVLANAQEVRLKDGTIYSGYVSEQLPGGNICITFDNVRYSVPGDSLQINYSGDSVASIYWGDKYFDNFDIWEEGDLVSFTSYVPGVAHVKLSDVKSITFACNDLVNDVIVAGRTYEGKIIENVVGMYTKMLVDDKVVVLAKNKITSQTKVAVDKEKSLNIKMFPFRDVYEMQKMPTLTGALISQNHADGSAIFLTREGSLMPLMVNKITCIRKIPNDMYDNSVPVEVDTVDVRINGEEAKWIPVMIDRRGDISFRLKDITDSIMMVDEPSIVVSVKKDMTQTLSLLPFNPFTGKSDIYDLGKREDWAIKVLRPSSTVTETERVITEYNQIEAGFYLLLDVSSKAVAPIWVNR